MIMMVLHKATIENEIPLYATMRTKKEKGSNILEKVFAITTNLKPRIGFLFVF
jgi:hypothetical protein